MRFLKISSYYRDFLNDYYSRFPEVVKLDYAGQYSHLMSQYFAWSDNYGRLLAQKGMETMEVIANALPMQKAWAKENGLNSNLSSEEIVCSQIEYFKPEVIYFQDSITFNGVFINRLKSKFPFIRLIIGNICAPFSSSQIEEFKAFDYFTVCTPLFRESLGKYGIKSVVIPHAFDKRILEKINDDNLYPETDFIFIGTIIPGEGFHNLRINILESLVKENIQFEFYGNLPDNSFFGLFKRKASYTAAHFLDSIGLKSVTSSIPKIRKGRALDAMPKRLNISKKLYLSAKPPVFGMEMFKAKKKKKIGFNIHGECTGNYAVNVRLFETTGVGTCLLTDMKIDLKNYFDIDNEIVAYSSAEECIEKIKYLIDNPEKCREIAAKGQQRTLREHNFESRVDMFYEYMIKTIKEQY
jgi:spore maturation protein CgeB